MRILVIGVFLGMLSGCTGSNGNDDTRTGVTSGTTAAAGDSLAYAEYDDYGFRVDGKEVADREVRRNESLYLILEGLGFSRAEIFRITSRAGDHIDFSDFKPGQQYRVYYRSPSTAGVEPDGEGLASAGAPEHRTDETATSGPMENDSGPDGSQVARLVWQSSATGYVVFDFTDSLRIYRGEHEVITRTASTSAEITSSLYMAVTDQGVSPVLAYRMSDVLAWQVDFFNLRRGDSFKVYYENRYINDEYQGVGRILALEFTHRGRTHRAYRFESGETEGYYDEEGNSVQKALLKAPFTYDQRISSGFNPRRFHPVLKVRRPHNGVDYAAPHGTAVLATGAGTVIDARYSGASGNFVKIRHNGTFDTAYLHLSGFARGIRSGATVDQGQVIGYVGATGRVTGTHLHYQLYRNDVPVNPLTIELPSSESVPVDLMDEFSRERNEMRAELMTIDRPHPLLTSN